MPELTPKCYGAQTADSRPDCNGPDVKTVRVFHHPEFPTVPFVTDWCHECRAEARRQGALVEVTASFSPSLREAIERSFSGKPRCCDWCDKRGTMANPLERLYIESDRLKPGTVEEYRWWVHSSCAQIILEDETVSASVKLGGY